MAAKACPSRLGPRMATNASPRTRLRVSMEKPVTGVPGAPRQVPRVALTIAPMVHSGSATLRLLLQRGFNRVMVGKGDHGRPYGLTRLMALARHEEHIAPLEPADGLGDRERAVADLDGAGCSSQYFAADCGRIFAARIVVGDDGKIGLGDGNFSHLRA